MPPHLLPDPLPLPARTVAVALALALALLGPAGGGCDSPAPRPAPAAPVRPQQQVAGAPAAAVARPGAPAAPAAAAPPTVRPTQASRVFVDVSRSKRGHVGPRAKKTALRQLQRLIDVSLGEAGAPGPERCSLGAVPYCVRWQEQDAGPKKCVGWAATPAINCSGKAPDYGQPGLYGAASSGAQSVLLRAPLPPTIDPDHPPAPDWLDQAELSVLVLSGPEPGPATPPAGASALEVCRGGPSPACLALALAARAAEGYGIWLVAVALEFDGSYMVDVPVDKRFVAAAQEHLRAVERVPVGGHTRYLGIDLKVSGQQPLPDRPGSSLFVYQGVRPLLIMALSRNLDKGRSFVRALTGKLAGDPAIPPGKMLPQDVVHAVELAPLGLPSYRLLSVEKAPPGPGERGGQGDLDPAALSELRLTGSGADASGLWGGIFCGAKGKAWVVVRYAELPGAIPPPGYLRTSLALVGPTGPEPVPPRV
ncbi:MAG: hypothetical protein FJ125_12375, partial [Deltaproteobacteria bacterium]|nr:hypothetical protein [Deltaproteobacteria bacterium]